MVEIDEHRIDIMIALLAKLVAANTEEDQVVALASTGLRTGEIARILNMKQSAVSMRIARSKEKKAR